LALRIDSGAQIVATFGDDIEGAQLDFVSADCSVRRRPHTYLWQLRFPVLPRTLGASLLGSSCLCELFVEIKPADCLRWICLV